ncbi:MAG: helix-turn-helix transcriptional regulator [Hyphomicrobiaceae bacterium]
MNEYLTTKELAELLRIKERKVYDLAASGEVPVSRAMGKLLFPRAEVLAWLKHNSSGLVGATAVVAERKPVFLGSHDPLLDWALRESRAGLATYFDGSLDGLERFAASEGIATGLHVLDGATTSWNVPLVAERFQGEQVVLVEWAKRERGLIVQPRHAKRVSGLDDIPGLTLVPRQREAGSQQILDHLLTKAGIDRARMSIVPAVRSESDAALAVLEGRADVAFGLEALASQLRLAFVPVIQERFDLLVDRRHWFEPPMQALVQFCQRDRFRTRASELKGYDTSGLGTVWFNGA